MPRPRLPLPLGALAIAGILGAFGCTTLGPMIGAPAADPGGCNPQVSASYRLQAEIPVGTLEIRVTDASGSPRASASVTATRLVYTGLKCLSMVSGTSDKEGLVRLERLRTGPYEVRLDDPPATASAQIAADQTTRVTLQQP